MRLAGATCRKENMFHYMAELVHGEKEHSDWFPERTTKMDHSRTDFVDLCFMMMAMTMTSGDDDDGLFNFFYFSTHKQ